MASDQAKEPSTVSAKSTPNEPEPVALIRPAFLIDKQRGPTAESEAQSEAARNRSRQIQKNLGSLMEQLGSRYSPTLASLDTYRIEHVNQRPVVAALRAANVEEMVKAGRGIVLLGAVGTGKDHLLAAMLYRAVQAGFSCRWLNGQEFYGELRDRMDSGASEDKRFRELKTPDVLAISDPIPPVGSPTSWNVTQLYRLLDRRYRDLRSTWVSMNAASVQDADEMLSSPSWDRLRESALILKCFWPSYREKRAI